MMQGVCMLRDLTDPVHGPPEWVMVSLFLAPRKGRE